MSELQQAEDSTPNDPGNSALFTPPAPESGERSFTPWIIAGIVVIVLVAGLLLAGRKKSTAPGNTVLPLASYAPSLAVSQLAMSESANISGGKYTYIDGHIKNSGSQTVTGITVQVLFANDVQLPPQINTVPLALIRTREPYVDTQPVSANPLAPGDDREFRLTFETIPDNWNNQMPEVRVVGVDAK